MPVILHKCLEHGLEWAVWKIEESVEEMVALSMDAEERAHEMSEIVSPKRKLEYLVTRLLLEYLSKKNAEVAYEKSGKPFLIDHSLQISLSHTKGYAAVAIHPKESIGIDIEANTSRIDAVKERVLSAYELQSIDQNNAQVHLLLHWSAKESVYKALGIEGVDFRTDLEVIPFHLNQSGEFILKERASEHKKEYQVIYTTSQDYVLTIAY